MDSYLTKLTDQLHKMFILDSNPNAKKLINKFFVYENANDFDNKFYDILVELVTYLYAQEHDINEITPKPIPELLPHINKGELLFSEYRAYLRKYKGLEVPQTGEVSVEKQDYYDLIRSSIINNILKTEGFWDKIDSSIIHDKEKEEEDIARLFIPVNNSNLYLFATSFLSKCERDKIDYSFKVNTDSTKQLGNNIEINVNNSNFDSTLNIINEIIEEYPGIFIDEEKLPRLAFPLTKKIGIVPALPDEPFEEKICIDIMFLNSSTMNFGELKLELGKILDMYYKDISPLLFSKQEKTK